ARAFEHLIPCDIAGLGERDRAARTIVDHLRWALIGAAFEKIDSEPTLPAYDARRIDAEPAQLGDASIGDRVLWKRGNVHGVHAQLRQRHGDIGLAAAEGRNKLRRLQKFLHPRRREAEHDLSE